MSHGTRRVNKDANYFFGPAVQNVFVKLYYALDLRDYLSAAVHFRAQVSRVAYLRPAVEAHGQNQSSHKTIGPPLPDGSRSNSLSSEARSYARQRSGTSENSGASGFHPCNIFLTASSDYRKESRRTNKTKTNSNRRPYSTYVEREMK